MKTSKYILVSLLFIAISCKTEPDSSEQVLVEYITSLANGDCERALELSVGEANSGTQYLLEEGCLGWKQEVLSVYCDENDSTVICQIRIKRVTFLNHPEETYNYTYSLEKIKDEWKVSVQWKGHNISEEEMKSMSLDTLENHP